MPSRPCRDDRRCERGVLPLLVAGEFLGFKIFGSDHDRTVVHARPRSCSASACRSAEVRVRHALRSGWRQPQARGHAWSALSSARSSAHRIWNSGGRCRPSSRSCCRMSSASAALAVQAALLGRNVLARQPVWRAPETSADSSQPLAAGWCGRWRDVGRDRAGAPQCGPADPLQPPVGRNIRLVLWGSKIGDHLGLTDSVFWLYWSSPATPSSSSLDTADVHVRHGHRYPARRGIRGSACRRVPPDPRRRHPAMGGRDPRRHPHGLRRARLSNGCNISAYFSSLAAGNAYGLALACGCAGGLLGGPQAAPALRPRPTSSRRRRKLLTGATSAFRLRHTEGRLINQRLSDVDSAGGLRYRTAVSQAHLHRQAVAETARRLEDTVREALRKLG